MHDDPTVAAVRAVIATALAGMGVLHLVPSADRRMAAIVPPSMRDRPLSARQLVLLTGGGEPAGVAGQLLPATRRGRRLAGQVGIAALTAVAAFGGRVSR